MTRLVAFLVALTLATALPERVVPAHADEVTGALCPMMSHQPSETPCIGAPCLCHHNPDGSPIRDDGRIGVPALTASIAVPHAPWALIAPNRTAGAVGFARLVYHPPDLSL